MSKSRRAGRHSGLRPARYLPLQNSPDAKGHHSAHNIGLRRVCCPAETSMARANSLAELLARINVLLAPHNFRKRGHVFFREMESVLHVIAVQCSRTKNSCRVTVNIGVSSRPILDRLGLPENPLDVPGSHWWERLGNLMPHPEDRWWLLSADSSSAESQICQAIEDLALPLLERFSTADEFLRRFADRESLPGGFSGVVDRYLHRVKNPLPE